MSTIPPPDDQKPSNGQPTYLPTIEALVSGHAWETMPSDHKIRFLVGMAQLFATGYGHIITQPCERVYWRHLVEAGYIALDEHDDFILHLTDYGRILFYSVLGQYLPIEERQ